MINTVEIFDEATFHDGAVITGLKPINYFYGGNGTGKTTISRVVTAPDEFATCATTWHGVAMEVVTYNREFVENHFREDRLLPGIFTLGADTAARRQEIQDAQELVASLRDEIRSLKSSLEGDSDRAGKIAQRQTLDGELAERCWQVRKKYEHEFKPAFAGAGSKDRLKRRVLEARAGVMCTQSTLEDLRDRAKTVFSTDTSEFTELFQIDTKQLETLESDPVMEEAVVGSSTVDIAALIEALENSDWVQAGRDYLQKSDGRCPFCQRAVSDDLSLQLEEFFDAKFTERTSRIAAVSSAYDEEAERVSMSLGDLLTHPSARFLDTDLVMADRDRFAAITATNFSKLTEKQKEPSRSIGLKESIEPLTQVNARINSANAKIQAHNRLVANLASERKALTSEFWDFIARVELSDVLSQYEVDATNADKAVSAIRQKLSFKEQELQKNVAAIEKLEKEITSTKPTVSAINKMLAAFGFSSFKLTSGEASGTYRLLRDDGNDAQKTLSEGERTFVSFLYFYHRLKGSANPTGTTDERVVVIDDPVCSLDSDVMIVVSTLVRELIDEIRNRNGLSKQLFLLTHNVYFHKEVTFDPKRCGKRKDETFWTVRKVNGNSVVDVHKGNPVTSSYQMLWERLKDEAVDSLTVQNTLRRILEQYFKSFGSSSLDLIPNQFEGPERLACFALLSWVNDGSHLATDDICVARDDQTVEMYREVFRKIFYKSHHGAHYEMMMGVEPSKALDSATENLDGVDESEKVKGSKARVKSIATSDASDSSQVLDLPSKENTIKPGCLF